MPRAAFRLAPLLVLLLGCPEPIDEDTAGLADGGAAGDGGAGDGGGEDTAPTWLSATISGSVTVELYTTDDDGERTTLSWDEATGGSYPFGSIYVAAYYEAEDGTVQYVGDTVIEDPGTDANPYTIPVQLDEPREVHVYAVLDWYQDRVVGSTEPRGIWPDGIELDDGTAAEDIDIAILAPMYGGGSCDTVTVSGDVKVAGYDQGTVVAMLVDTDGNGPYYTGSAVSPTPDGDEATGAYSLEACVGAGTFNLVGCWDRNLNGMYDPTDAWGVFVSEPDTDGNPVSVGSLDLAGYDVQIPFGSGPGVAVVPFVAISGTVQVEDGTFDDLPAGTSVWVAALKYRPNAEFAIDGSSLAYDVQSFDWAELTGQSSVDWRLDVPANTRVYLWAYADTDGDGTVNESGEPVASGGSDDSGRLDAGTTASTGNDLELAVAEGR